MYVLKQLAAFEVVRALLDTETVHLPSQLANVVGCVMNMRGLGMPLPSGAWKV